MHFFIFSLSANAFYDIYSGIVDASIFIRTTLLCLYNKQNNTWLLVDMKFLFSCSTRHLTHSLCSLVSYRGKTRREIPYLRAPMYYSLFITWGGLKGCVKTRFTYVPPDWQSSFYF